jgi:glycerophosphoryl diester phosphodiesterase
VRELAERLTEIPGVVAVTLAGSGGGGVIHPDSDWHLGRYYRDAIRADAVGALFDGLTVVSPDFIADAHANKLAVHVWTVNDSDDMRRVLGWGVDGIMTGRPRLLEQILAEFKRKKPNTNP